MIMIQCRGLEKTLRNTEREFRVKVPSFTLAGSERKAIVGSTGSGKTTIMDILAMVSSPDRCERFLLQHRSETIDLLEVGRHRSRLARLRARYFGYVMQKSPLFPFLTVSENVALQQQISSRRDQVYANTLMGMLGIDMLSGALPSELSVGQRQRAAIARSLSHRPSVILCDEPTGALDPVTAKQAMDAILWAAEQTGAAIVMITHDWTLASKFGFSFNVMQTEVKKGTLTVNSLQSLEESEKELRA